MKPTTVSWIQQKKFLVVNVAFLFIISINTVIFHVYNYNTHTDRMVDHVVKNKHHWVSHHRLHGKRSTVKRHDTISSSVLRTKSANWIVVHLQHTNKSLDSDLGEGYLSFLDNIQHWTVVIIGPAASSKHGCNCCHNLARDDDQPGANSLFDAITTGINNGARNIYVMTSLHDVRSALSRMTSYNNKNGITYTGLVPFKPCSHFVQPLLSSSGSFFDCHDRNWIYSYTSGEYPDKKITSTCEECGQSFPGPETSNLKDAIYCDDSTPNVAIKPGTLVNSKFENTLWTYESFWAMFVYNLHQTSPSRTEQLKFSYIVQRLLWEIQISLSFVRSHNLNFTTRTYPVNGQFKRHNQYRIRTQFCREGGNSAKLRSIYNHLYKWSCPKTLTITTCVNVLTEDLLNVKLITKTQRRFIQAFMVNLNKTSYVLPERVNQPRQSVTSYIEVKAKAVHFWPSAKHRHWSQSPFHSYCSQFPPPSSKLGNKDTNTTLSTKKKKGSEDFDYYYNNDDNSSSIANKKPVIDYNIVLVIIFQSSDPTNHIQMANFYDYQYGRHFRHIIYCTSGTENIETFAKMYPQPMNVIDLKLSDPRFYSYICISEAMRMYHNSISGYLHVTSATLLNPWTLDNLVAQIDKPWLNAGTMETKLYEQEVDISDESMEKLWKDRVYGRRALNNSVQDLLFISKTIDKHVGMTNSSSNFEIVQYLTKYNRIVKKFLTTFNTNRLSQFKVRFGMTLVYFVPVQFREQFVVLADEFSRYNVHSDIVVPTILKTLDSNFLELNGTVVPTKHTSFVLAAYNSQNVFLHPWEMHLLRTPRRSKFMCTRYLPRLESSLRQRPTEDNK